MAAVLAGDVGEDVRLRSGALRVLGNRGGGQGVEGVSDGKFLVEGKFLSISLDQHSVGWSNCFFLKRGLRLNVIAIGDFAHKVWNDCKVALGRARMWEIILLSSILFNVNFGPWDGSKWWRTCQEAASEYFGRVGSSKCKLFLSMLPAIAHERSETHMMTDPQYAEDLWAELQSMEALQWKGPKMALCRWFSWHECYRFWQGRWTMRALVMLYWGLQLGYLTEEPGTNILERSGVLKPISNNQGNVSQASTMREAKAAQNKLYRQTKNQLHVASLVAIDKDIKEGSAIVHACCRPLHGWHAAGIREVRSAIGNVRWHARQAASECLEPLSQTFALLSDTAQLSALGFVMSAGDLPLAVLGDEDCQVLLQEEKERVAQIVRLCFELVRVRAKSCSVYLEQYPLRCAAMLVDKGGGQEIARTLCHMKATASSRHWPAHTCMCSRTPRTAS